MPLWPLKGGTVADPATQQNLEGLAEEGGRIESELIVPRVAELPASGKKAQLLFNEKDNKLYYFNGTEWVVV